MSREAAVYAPNLVRGLAIVVAGYDLLMLPWLVYRRTSGDRRRVTELVFSVGCVLLLLGQIAGSVHRFDEPLRWYGAPLLLVASVLIAVAAYPVLRRRR